MKYGICLLSVIPVRFEPADASEMVNQILFGELYKVTDVRAKWIKIRTAIDGYEGWIDKKQHTEILKSKYKEFNAPSKTYCAYELVGVSTDGNQNLQPILLGSTLPFYANGVFQTSSYEGTYAGAVIEPGKHPKGNLVENAFMYLNAPYLWGGRSPFGIDCSGFSQVVYKMNGVWLPRDASQQAELGETLSFVEESEPGDLAFFDNEEGNIIHVGILLEDNYIIHASGNVRVDRIDHQGIYHAESKSYSHKLRLIKRII